MLQAEDTLTAGPVASRDSRERDTEHTLAHRPLSRDIPPEMIEPPAPPAHATGNEDRPRKGASRRPLSLSRRERLFNDFIVLASKGYADALTHEVPDPPTLMRLYELTMDLADEVIRRIATTYYEPNRDCDVRQAVQAGEYDLAPRPSPWPAAPG